MAHKFLNLQVGPSRQFPGSRYLLFLRVFLATKESDQILLGQGIDNRNMDESREQGRLQVQGRCGDLGFYFPGALEKAGTVPLMLPSIWTLLHIAVPHRWVSSVPA